MAEDALDRLKKETGYAEVPEDGDDGGIDALIDYKNALEDHCGRLEEALHAISLGVPQGDEWASAAGFMEYVAAQLDRFGIERPEHYPDDFDPPR